MNRSAVARPNRILLDSHCRVLLSYNRPILREITNPNIRRNPFIYRWIGDVRVGMYGRIVETNNRIVPIAIGLRQRNACVVTEKGRSTIFVGGGRQSNNFRVWTQRDFLETIWGNIGKTHVPCTTTWLMLLHLIHKRRAYLSGNSFPGLRFWFLNTARPVFGHVEFKRHVSKNYPTIVIHGDKYGAQVHSGS